MRSVLNKDVPLTPAGDTFLGYPEPGQRVYIIDDDDLTRAVIVKLVSTMNVPWMEYSSGEAFLAALPQLAPAGCIVSDIRLSGISGPQLQQELQRRSCLLPIIFVTGFADVRLAVQVMQAGAVTLLEKPCRQQELWEAIRSALRRDSSERQERMLRQAVDQRIRQLAEVERRILDLVLFGASNKAIAMRLKMSLRTVEHRRSEVFRKMQAESIAVLVRMTLQAGYVPSEIADELDDASPSSASA